jgi:hypothetical protein
VFALMAVEELGGEEALVERAVARGGSHRPSERRAARGDSGPSRAPLRAALARPGRGRHRPGDPVAPPRPRAGALRGAFPQLQRLNGGPVRRAGRHAPSARSRCHR